MPEVLGLERAESVAPERTSVVLVGNPGVEHVGNHLRNAARNLGVGVRFCDSEAAFRANRLAAKFNWFFRGHRPTHLRKFSERVADCCADAGCVLTTGLAPVDGEALDAMGRAGVVRMNFLTDDPWNPKHSAEWFMRAVPRYDVVFTPRRANMGDLLRGGCRRVEYLPFAYAPEIHYPEAPATPEEEARFSSDVLFAGGADSERVPWVSGLIGSGMRVALYGGYWSRYAATRACDRGIASADVLRKALGGARIALCLVRRANRDGHAMRTYELAAGAACILAEDTEEHRDILGPEGRCAVYFRSVGEMVEKARALLRDSELRARMSAAVRERVCGGGNTYRDRLSTMLRVVGLEAR